ncbi:hypothetical protein ACFWPU_36900 [Streptomyces sp. NPDC058471]|uniref:hypothetical protein n=1 Tax=Streptomyces sp. NPDC058471 TaxID=3346516 RepID=UPI00365A6F51
MAAVLALAGGCADEPSGCDAKPKLSSAKGEKRPVEIEPSQQHPGIADSALDKALPPPDLKAEPVEKVLNHLRQETLDMAGAIGKTDAGKCEGEVVRPRGETVRCTVVFEGVTVPWLVTSKGMTSGSAGIFSQDFVYTARPLKTVHTAQSVYDLYAWEQGKNGTTQGPLAPVDPRCDRLPKVFTAEPGKNTGYFCQDISTSCTDGVQDVKWLDQAIHVDKRGQLSFLA